MQEQRNSPLVFVVDDDSSTVHTINGFLKRAGFRTASAGDVAGALQGIRELHPDLVLLDVNLPDGSGFDVCRALNANAAAFATPILFISANEDTASKVLGFEVGGLDYIAKPIVGAEVIARVRTHLRLKQAYERMSVAITREEMPVWSRYIEEICGIHLDDSKGYLLETRLGGLLSEAGALNFSEFFYKAKADTTARLRGKIVEAITTNETSFFRDTSPFDLLRNKLIPDIVDRRSKSGGRIPIRIWSAACSTGQEAYSTGIVLKELLGDLNRYDIRILGTDISNKVVAQASYGEYNRLEMDRGLPSETLNRHFTVSGDRWKIRDEIRAMATFRTMNLLEPFSFPQPFDIIFCRNVAIYFTETDKKKLFHNLVRFMAKDGGLIIGSTESISGLCPEVEPKRYMRTVFYQWKDTA